jgi:hypothetical protein
LAANSAIGGRYLSPFCEADESRARVREIGIQQHRGVPTDQVSFYDESLKKQIEGSFKTDGKSIHVSSAYGVMSFPYNDLGASIDHDAQVLLVQKLLSELARDPDSGKFMDLQQQRGDQQPQGSGSTSAWGGGNGPGANP